MVNIKGLDKAEVLLALWKHSHEQGMSFFGTFTNNPTLGDCRNALKQCNNYIDYFNGRVIKVDFSGDEFNPGLYDRDCGSGAAQRAVDSIRK
ncbi:MAG: hypothetical protein NC548_13210 [Lachnospiraceae bacterium]|nr:hypothetical protein [Lachnospiraceae bacterium]MCM1230651.1 hypothetical protein [Ruminococcus flavefaciens]MCM1439993.1 hypothetical protein [Roseburia sp.]